MRRVMVVARRVTLALIVLLAVASVGHSWVLVARHAAGTETLRGVRLRLVEVEVVPSAEHPITLLTEAFNETGRPFAISLVFAVLEMSEGVAGIRTPWPVSLSIPAGAVRSLVVPLELSWQFEDSWALARAIEGKDPGWKASYEITVLIPHRREQVSLKVSVVPERPKT